jgi:hypothetical protein
MISARLIDTNDDLVASRGGAVNPLSPTLLKTFHCGEGLELVVKMPDGRTRIGTGSNPVAVLRNHGTCRVGSRRFARPWAGPHLASMPRPVLSGYRVSGNRVKAAVPRLFFAEPAVSARAAAADLTSEPPPDGQEFRPQSWLSHTRLSSKGKI